MATVGLNLPQLQNLIKRDPLSYRDDFFRQLRHLNSMMDIMQFNPSEEVQGFGELLMFLAQVKSHSHFCRANLLSKQVSHCYKAEVDGLPEKMLTLLRQQHGILHPEMRRALVQALMLMRTRKLIDQMELLSLFLSLLRCRDKALRQQLFTYIVSDLKTSNQRCKNGKLNKAIQNRMFDMINGGAVGTDGTNITAVADGSDIASKLCLDICIELYRRNIWNDAKTVNIISQACFSPHNKVLIGALKFFLGADKDSESVEDASDEEDGPDMKKLRYQAVITKNSKNRRAKIERALKTLRRKSRQSERVEHFNFSAIHLLNDPQGMAEKLFLRLTRPSTADSPSADEQQKIKVVREVKFEIRLMIMNLISRLIGLNKLILLGFYSYVVRYLKPHQPDVTHILAYCAQASHDLIPPDSLEGLLRVIMDNFVSDSYASEVIACGINSIREVCNRCPLAMTSELMGYILSFKSNRDKGVAMAIRSIIKLYREVNPALLPKRERGKVASMDVSADRVQVLQFGQRRVADGVDGAELLQQIGDGEEGDDDEAAWDVGASAGGEGVDEDADDGWIKMNHDSNDEGGESEADLMSSECESEDDSEFIQDEWEQDESMDEGAGGELGEDDEEMESVSEQDEADGKERISTTTVVKGQSSGNQQRLETRRILTPADFARLKRLREEAQAEHMVDGGAKRSNGTANNDDDDNSSEFVSTDAILGPQKRRKMNREERIACVMEGRKDREKFGSRKGKDRGSITNREKSKRKNMVMMSHKRGVLQKKKLSLRDKQRRLRKHIDHQKKQI